MPFKGTLVGRALRLFGLAGTKIIAFIDNNGVPRIDFYTGDASEAAPASIFTVVDTPVPGQFAIVIQGPDPSGSQDPAQLILGSLDTQLINYNQGGILALIHDFSGNKIEIGPSAFGGIVYTVPNGEHIFNDGKVVVQDGLDVGSGRNITGIDFGEITANTQNGNGTLNYSHNLGGPGSDIFVVATHSGASNARFLTRVVGGDTASVFQCRAWNADGTNPPNGTGVPCSYIGLKLL